MIKLGHRGYSEKYPENTMIAFKKAIEGNFDGVETDVHLTKDNRLVLIHDEKINIEQNSRIQIEENNIIFKVPITPFEAVLGGNISIPSFDGNLSLKIPAKTHSGQKFRLAGQGIKQNGKIGDMIIITDIEIPSSLSDDEIRLYEKLKKLSVQNLRENLLNG